MCMTRRSMWSKLFVLTMIGFGAGCNIINSIGPGCDRSPTSNPPVVYDEVEPENGLYMSSPWAGELLYFPGGTRYEIHHKLGATPHFVQPWLSFARCGTQKGTLALAAGNQAEIKEVGPETLVIVNGSCSDYWLLVVAGLGAEVNPPPMDDMVPDAGDGACGPDGGGAN